MKMMMQYRSTTSPKLPIAIMQTSYEVEVLYNMIKKFKPELYVELGTGWGGLTLYLNQQFPDMEIVSFDINYDVGIIAEAFTNRVAFVRQNVLKKSNLVVRLLNLKEKKFLYCDNGDRIVEINNYAEYLSKGDILGVHDYDEKIKEGIRNTIKSFRPYALKGCIENEASIRLWVKE